MSKARELAEALGGVAIQLSSLPGVDGVALSLERAAEIASQLDAQLGGDAAAQTERPSSSEGRAPLT